MANYLRPFQVFIFCLSFSILSFSQSTIKYRIRFKDKNNTPFTISGPEAFLSQKAIERRNRQGIAISENDIPINPAYIDSIKNAGFNILNRSKWFNSIIVSTSDSVLVNTVKNFSFVVKIDTVAKKKMKTSWQSDKLKFAESTVLSSSQSQDYGVSFNQISMLRGNEFHDNCLMGQGITIAVIDAGFTNVNTLPAFDSLRANGRILGTWDFVSGNAEVYSDHSHGTYVLSTMGAYLPGELIGTAPQANYWLLRSEDGGSEKIIEEDNWVAAAEFADSAGADIINTSLGYNTFDDPDQNHTYADMNGNTTRITIAADIAASKGMLLVNAAGNEGSGGWKYIIAPADADSVLTVGAVDSNGYYAYFSSKGPTADGRIKPDVCAQGLYAVAATTSGGTTTAVNGTSIASPIIAGMAACLWQANPSASNMEIFNAIRQSADQAENPDTLKGYGVPDFVKAHEILSGTGRLPYLCPGLVPPGLIKIKPNPVIDILTIDFYAEKDQHVTAELFDITGRKVYFTSASALTGNRSLTLTDMYKSGNGIYILKVTLNDNVIITKLAKL